jgi:Amt family ammonium transporter
VLTVAAFAAVCMVIVFLVIKAVCGLRVSEEEEILGLDSTEHGLESAYAGFLTTMDTVSGVGRVSAAVKEMEYEPSARPSVSVNDAVPVQVLENESTIASDVKLSKVAIVCKQSKFEDLKAALNAIGVSGITVTQVLGCGTQKGTAEYYRGVPVEFTLLPKIKVEVIVSAVPVAKVVAAAKEALYTGHIGDGKIFVYDVAEVIKVRTGETGFDALQDDN